MLDATIEEIQGLFDGSLPIDIVRGDACVHVASFPSSSYDCIIHDPPARAICSTDLYGINFYKELRRVLKDGGQLYHYIGNPDSKESGSLYAGVLSRLTQAGFRAPKDCKSAFGLTVIADAPTRKVTSFSIRRRPGK